MRCPPSCCLAQVDAEVRDDDDSLSMLKFEMTMILSQVIADVVASVRCSCPTLVLLRWDAEMLCLSLKTDVV